MFSYYSSDEVARKTLITTQYKQNCNVLYRMSHYKPYLLKFRSRGFVVSHPVLNILPGMENRQANWPRGKVLGGTSVLNYMLYIRGNKRDYDKWEALGNTGWGYDAVLPYFKKSEDNKNSNFTKTPYHSSGGYLTVSENLYETRILEAFLEGGKQLGYENRDGNGEFQTGFMKAQGKKQSVFR